MPIPSLGSAWPPAAGAGAARLIRSLRWFHDAPVARLRRSAGIVRILFGVSVSPPAPEHSPTESLWDYTTLVLCKAIDRYLVDGMRVWDLGCGPIALLARYCRIRADVEVIASDADAACVTRSRGGLGPREAPLLVVESDLGADVPGTFDLVLLNAPYLPADRRDWWPCRGRRTPHVAARYERRFSGGAGGLETITRFLDEAPARLNPRGLALLGFNRWYVSERVTTGLVVARGWTVRDRITRAFNPSIVLALEPR